ncbi:uncharacterized protein [Cherax quadricarinatus]
MQHNQVFVIQVSSGTKLPLALPAPPDTLLPSEVKYSASLVRGLGFAHIILGAVLFLLGVLGSWVEPETCWSGAGVWSGMSTMCCGISGLIAHRLWYKNFTIKTFLVSSVVSLVITVLAVILTIYAIVNRQQHYFHLLEQAENNPWFQPYDLDREHRLTLSVSANQLVGFTLELVLSLWSTKVGWRGVHAPEFSAARREAMADDCHSVASLPHPGQQVPLAAIYQLLQAHPELLGSKTLGGGLGTQWSTGLDDRPPYNSMDYQERVSRFLSHAIEDQNTSFSRSPSTLRRETRRAPSPITSSPTASCTVSGSGGRGSPAETVIMLAGSPGQKHNLSIKDNFVNENKHRNNKAQRMEHKPNSEHKVKAPAPKIKIKESEKSVENNKLQETQITKVINSSGGENKINVENKKISDADIKKSKDEAKDRAAKEQEVHVNSKQFPEPNVSKTNAEDHKTYKNTEECKIVEEDEVTETSIKEENAKQENKIEDKLARAVDTAEENKSCVKTEKDVIIERSESSKTINDKISKCDDVSTADHSEIVAYIQPPCQFQDKIFAEQEKQ